MVQVSKISAPKLDMLDLSENAIGVSAGEVMFDYSPEGNVDTYVSNKKTFVSESLQIKIDEFTKLAGIKKYSPTILRSDNEAILASKGHLIDLLKYYEGDRNYYYEGVNIPYKDGAGKLTYGFGTLTKTRASKSNDDAYKAMIDMLSVKTKEVETVLAKAGIGPNDLPMSVKEALIDLSYNKGTDEIDDSEALWQISHAFQNNEWERIFPILDCTDISEGETPVAVKAGLYRRSLSRMILATRDLTNLSKNEQRKVEDRIINFYNIAKDYHEDNGIQTIDLEKIYQSFAEGDVTGTPISSEASKHKVKAGESYASIAKQFCPEGKNVEEFTKLLKVANYNASLQVGDYLTVPLLSVNASDFSTKPSQSVKHQKVSEVQSPTQSKNCIERTFTESTTFFSLAKSLLPKDKQTAKYLKPCIVEILKVNGYSIKYDKDGYPIAPSIEANSTLFIPKSVTIAGETIALVKASDKPPVVTENKPSETKSEKGLESVKKKVASWFKPVNTGLTTELSIVEDYDKNLVGEGREYLRRRKDLSGKTMATREVFDPTGSGRLDGKVIIVNAGHGFMDPNSDGIDLDVGAKARNGLPHEYQINYDNSMILIENLRKMGATVIYLQGKEGKDSDGKALISNELRKPENRADFFISLHVNTAPASYKSNRVEFHYSKDSSSGSLAAGMFEEAFDNAYSNQEYSKSKGGELQVLKTAASVGLTGVLWELGFISTAQGRKNLSSKKTMQKYADLVSSNIVKYFEENTLYRMYTVKNGDVLEKIAMAHDTTTTDLMRINNLVSSEIKIGQVLKIPKA